MTPLLLLIIASTDLGLSIAEVGSEVVIVDIAEDSWADHMGFVVGQIIVSVDGEAVSSTREVERLLRTGRSRRQHLLEVEERHFFPPIPRSRHRIALLVQGHLRSDQPASKSAYLGISYGYAFWPQISAVISLGYVPVGKTAFVDGRNASTLLAGLEYDHPIVEDVAILVRLLAGPNFPWDNFDRWTVERVTATLHVGVRLWPVGVFAAGGFGPAQGLNLGAGLSISFDFGARASGAVEI